jgi:glycosyltransferase involved in cell wall biosynthesis
MGNQLANHTNNGLFKWCLKRANLIILLAKKWEKLFEEHFCDVNVPTKVLYNASTHVEKVNWKRKKKLIIMVGYMNDNKAPNLLLKAWAMIRNRYPNWKVVMLGNGEVDRFKQMTSEMGLQDSVKFTGYLVGDEKKRYFEEASIYCMCSYQEGFPMVVLEAWEYKICVVTTPVGGLPDVIEEGNNALVFDFGDWQGLAEHLMRLMDNESKRKTMADYSYGFVEEHFSAMKINKAIEEIYYSL